MAVRGRGNPLALAVLAHLYERPMHPYEISSTLRERRKEESIRLNYGSLYSVVESLQKRGLITTQETVREGRRPERTVYAITEAGVTELYDWLSDLVAQPVQEFTQFEAALSLLPVLAVEDAVTLLESRLRAQVLDKQTKVGWMERSRELGFPRLFQIEAEYKMALLSAEIEYIRTLIAELKAGTLPGVSMWRRLHELKAQGLPPDDIDATIANEFKEELSWFDRLTEDPKK